MNFRNIRVSGFEAALRGMRNPKESWRLSDSQFGISDWDNAWDIACEQVSAYKQVVNPGIPICINDTEVSKYYNNMILYDDDDCVEFAAIGPKDMKLAQTLIKAGPEHRKFMRQIIVSVDITAPRYFWTEFDTYKVGTVANSTSTMHKLTSKPITLNCFEIDDYNEIIERDAESPYDEVDKIYQHINEDLIPFFELLRQRYLETNDKRYWKELVRWLPAGWLQTRTVTMNYENLLAMCSKGQRRFHKLTEWSGDGEDFTTESFINFARSLPYAQEFIFIDELETNI